MGAMEDTDQLQDSGESLRQCQERFDRLMEISSEAYWEQDEHCRFTLLTGGILAKSNIDPNTFLGTTRWDHGAVPLDQHGNWDQHQALLAARQPFTDFIFKRPGSRGGMRYISTSGQPMSDKSGRFKGYCGVSRDITGRIRAEQLQRLEDSVAHQIAKAHSANEAMTAVIRAICEAEGWECGRYFRVDDTSGVLRFGVSWGVPEPKIQTFLERSRELIYNRGVGLMGRVWQSGEALWVADVSKDERAIRAAFAAHLGIRGGFVFPVLAEGKTIGTLAFNTRALRESDERLMRAIRVIGGQIGQYLRQKEAEEELRRFRAAMDASADLMLLIDRASVRYIDVNDAACRALGYSRQELQAMGPPDIFSKTRDELVRLYDRMFAGDLSAPTVEGVYRCKDGSELLIEAYPRAVRSPSGDIVVSIARDIRERKREEQLRDLEHAVTRCLAKAESESAGLTSVIAAICNSVGWECGRYFRLDEAAGVLRFAEFWSVPGLNLDDYIARSRTATYASGAGLMGRVLQLDEVQWAADLAADPRAAKRVRSFDSGLRGAFNFPVTAEGKVIGVLGFNSRNVHEPDERLLRTIRVIGSQIGQFVQRKQAAEVLRKSEARFRSLTHLSSDEYWEQDHQYRFTLFSGARSDTSDSHEITLIGKRPWDLSYANMSAEDWTAHVAILDAHKPFHDLELCWLEKSGEKAWVSVCGEPVFDESGAFKGYRGVGKDITARKQAEARIEHLANHDSLTALPNRAMFSAVLNAALQNAQRYHRNFAVLFIDLDRFKVINDTLGHEAGDQLLQEMGRRLVQTVRASDAVARMGGDEFVVLVQEVNEAGQVEAVARKILSALIKPISIMGQECRVTASIGVCMYPADAQDEQALMKNADIAMYRAKEEGKNTFKFYSSGINSHSFERLALETSLRLGLERSEFFLHYQAKLDLATRRITGVEALVRWQHPDLGMVPPGQFIPLAEETGLIVPIGKWVLNTACVQNMAWQKSGLPALRMAVNLSARQFADENLLQDIAEALRDSAMPAHLLELELTESMVMQDAERAGRLLADIKRMGTRLAIDDFGVGYSSLNHLRRFPIDTLKVDRSFIRELPHNSEDRAIAEAIIAMGKSLKLTVVAEGVETLEQETFLRECACDESQGYYFSKPVANDQFEQLLRAHLAPCA